MKLKYFCKKIKRLFCSNSTNNKIRIVAIAKDESAYLPAWIHHHLSFGFDDIEIYINNTTDQSQLILEKIGKKYPVSFILADYMFQEGVVFQKYAYEQAYAKARKDNINYLMFLDIDEFWTPLDFKTNIHQCLEDLKFPDIISFEWALKRNEEIPFSFPYSHTNCVSQCHILKSIFKVSLDVEKIDVHNVVAKGANNLLANGKQHPFPGQWSINSDNISVKKYFILHRLWRSELEYVYTLNQGMRAFSKQKESGLSIKTNRSGYLLPESNLTTINFDSKLIDKQIRCYHSFLKRCGLQDLVKDAELFVIDRCIIALESFDMHKDNKALKKATTNINLEYVKEQVLKIRLKKSK